MHAYPSAGATRDDASDARQASFRARAMCAKPASKLNSASASIPPSSRRSAHRVPFLAGAGDWVGGSAGFMGFSLRQRGPHGRSARFSSKARWRALAPAATLLGRATCLCALAAGTIVSGHVVVRALPREHDHAWRPSSRSRTLRPRAGMPPSRRPAHRVLRDEEGRHAAPHVLDPVTQRAKYGRRPVDRRPSECPQGVSNPRFGLERATS